MLCIVTNTSFNNCHYMEIEIGDIIVVATL